MRESRGGGEGPGQGPTTRQGRDRQPNQTSSGPAHTAHDREDQGTGRVRQGRHREWLARNRQRGRDRRHARGSPRRAERRTRPVRLGGDHDDGRQWGVERASRARPVALGRGRVWRLADPATDGLSTVQTVVPAKVRIRIAPRIVPWGSEIHPDGHFVIVWKFNPGRGVLHPWFSVGTLAEAAFPYAPGTSRRIFVALGGPTPPAAVRHRHHAASQHRHRKHRKRHKRR